MNIYVISIFINQNADVSVFLIFPTNISYIFYMKKIV